MFDSLTEVIGKTPLLKLKCGVLAKLEYFNPAGSVKDRAVKSMIEQAEYSGILTSDTTVIEPTSGNTGIAIAAICAAKGIKAVIVMPDSFSVERRKIIAAYGAETVLTDGRLGMSGAIEKARELQKNTPKSVILDQFDNPANPAAHYKTTAPEIWDDAGGKVDIFVAGVGTGGTLSGAGRYFKEKNPAIKVVAVEPQSSPVLSGGQSGAHQIQGIGAGFVPNTLDLSVVDEVLTVPDGAAIYSAKELALKEGLLVGISSGAAYWAAKELAARNENKGKIIVTVFPDGGEKYLSTELF
ncbi:MAG: cysteine synthase A [Clostridia bacterium]|nr:cysteine synthase A [Clostridia bacterium]